MRVAARVARHALCATRVCLSLSLSAQPQSLRDAVRSRSLATRSSRPRRPRPRRRSRRARARSYARARLQRVPRRVQKSLSLFLEPSSKRKRERERDRARRVLRPHPLSRDEVFFSERTPAFSRVAVVAHDERSSVQRTVVPAVDGLLHGYFRILSDTVGCWREKTAYRLSSALVSLAVSPDFEDDPGVCLYTTRENRALGVCRASRAVRAESLSTGDSFPRVTTRFDERIPSRRPRCLGGRARLGVLDDAEAARPTRRRVGLDDAVRDAAVRRKVVPELIRRHRVRNVADVEPRACRGSREMKQTHVVREKKSIVNEKEHIRAPQGDRAAGCPSRSGRRGASRGGRASASASGRGGGGGGARPPRPSPSRRRNRRGLRPSRGSFSRNSGTFRAFEIRVRSIVSTYSRTVKVALENTLYRHTLKSLDTQSRPLSKHHARRILNRTPLVGTPVATFLGLLGLLLAAPVILRLTRLLLAPLLGRLPARQGA